MVECYDKENEICSLIQIDQIINAGEIPMSKENPPGRIVRTNNHQNFISYADMLKGYI